jgi:hypothetical protein
VGTDADTDERRFEANKEFITMVANFLLLSVESGNRGRSVIIHREPRTNVLVRRFDFSNGGTSAFCPVSLRDGIDLNAFPESNAVVYYSWYLLGYGSTGSCCLATAESRKAAPRKQATGNSKKVKSSSFATGAPCVVKIYHRDASGSAGIVQSAKAEEGNWKAIYGDRNWTFVQGFYTDAYTVLIMPFFVRPITWNGVNF